MALHSHQQTAASVSPSWCTLLWKGCDMNLYIIIQRIYHIQSIILLYHSVLEAIYMILKSVLNIW